MSQHATELCLLLVDDIYGDLTSRAFGVLISYGRLTFSAILSHSGLTPRQLKHSLAVLVQQHLALWYTSPDDDATHYEANWPSAYALVRSGKLIKLVEDRFGNFAGGLVSNLLLLGHAQVGDLARAYDLANSGDGSNRINGAKLNTDAHLPNGLAKNSIKGGHVPTLQSFQTTLYTLIRAGYVSTVHESHFRSEADNKSEAEKDLQRNPEYRGPLKGAEKFGYAQALKNKLAEWRFNTKSEDKLLGKFEKSRKRLLGDAMTNGNDRTGKRIRIDSDAINYVNGYSHYGDGHDSLSLDDNLVLRVNYEKFAVAARNKRLVELVEKCIGKAASQLYAELLMRLEKEVRCCNLNSHMSLESDSYEDPEDSSGVSTMELNAALRDIVDWDNSIGHADSNKSNVDPLIHPKKRRRKLSGDEIEVKDESSLNGISNTDVIDFSQDSGSSSHNDLIRQNLLLLAEHPYRFVRHIRRMANQPESWSVNFTALSRQLRLIELENIITSRYSTDGLRIIRILQEKGKLDEKAIGNFGLMNSKVLRSYLTTMHESGHLELQEVPRDSNRQPSRTMFLWFFEPERCRQKVLEQTYKTMARCLQRVKVEREAVQTLLDKAARTDVVGKEDEYLGLDERTALEDWREREGRLLGEVGRLDDLVAVMRDF